MNVNVNLLVENVTHIKSGIMVNVDVSESKKIIFVKKIVFGILLHVIAKIVKHLANVMDDLVIMCNEIIDVDVEISCTTKKQKLFHQILMKRK